MGQMMYRSPALRWTTAKAPPQRDRTVHTNQPPVKSPASLGKRDTMTGRFWKDWRMGCGVTRNLRSSVAFWWSDGAGRSKDGIRYDTIIYRCLYGILRCRWSLRVAVVSSQYLMQESTPNKISPDLSLHVLVVPLTEINLKWFKIMI